MSLDRTDGQLFVEVMLANMPSFWHRAILAVKYMFGYRTRYGMYDCIELEREQYDDIRAMLDSSEHIMLSQERQFNPAKATPLDF
jgi:hypothetical protein